MLRRLHRRFQCGDWSAELAHDCTRHMQKQPDAAGLCLYLDVRHCLDGVDESTLERIGLLQHETGITADTLVLRLASHAHRLGQPAGPALFAYREHTRRRFRRRSVARSLTGYPLLLASCDEPDRAPYRLSSRELGLLPLAQALEARLVTWKSLLNRLLAPVPNHPVTIAVVGNAPTLLERDDGERIDSADLVIRFNRVELTPPLTRHTGSRTDLWIRTPSVSPDHRPTKARAIAISGSVPFVRPSRYWQTLVAKELRLPSLGKAPALSGLDADSWHALVATLQAPPSAGLLTIASLRRTRPSAHLEVYGFSGLAGARGSNHYGDRDKASSRHDWSAETAWLEHHGILG